MEKFTRGCVILITVGLLLSLVLVLGSTIYMHSLNIGAIRSARITHWGQSFTTTDFSMSSDPNLGAFVITNGTQSTVVIAKWQIKDYGVATTGPADHDGDVNAVITNQDLIWKKGSYADELHLLYQGNDTCIYGC